MKRPLSKLLVLGFLSLFFLGCVTEEYAREHADLLGDRICRLEARVAAIDDRISQLEKLTSAVSFDVDQARVALAAARELLQDAIGEMMECCNKADVIAEKVEAAAAAAEAAADKAESRAEKAEKAFKLERQNH